MIRQMLPRYKEWNQDPQTKAVVLRGAGGKAFCSGGDVRALYDAKKSRTDGSLLQNFFQEEYALNEAIGTLRAPQIAILDGITMGGGAGLSVHGAIRIATENTLFAMPETAIGFIPDVGCSFFLPRLQPNCRFIRDSFLVSPLGLYLGLSGQRLKGVEAYLAGIATHFVPAASIDRLVADLMTVTDSDDVLRVVQKYHSKEIAEVTYQRLPKLNEYAPFNLNLDAIYSVFDWSSLSSRSVEDRIRYLDHHAVSMNHTMDWAKQAKETLLKMSPLALKVTNELLTRGAGMETLKTALQMEYRVGQKMLQMPDFFEGVRAALVDKDHKPKWRPARLAEITVKGLLLLPGV
jgi:3-hydroxyisobutyryl-CoA hydrolase